MRELCISVNVRRMVESEPLSEASALCLSCEVVWWRVGHTAAGHVVGGVLGKKGKQDENPWSGWQVCCGREGKAGKNPPGLGCRLLSMEHTWRLRVLSSGRMSRVFSHDDSDGMSQLGLGRRMLQFLGC